jgi:hypothetical protein
MELVDIPVLETGAFKHESSSLSYGTIGWVVKLVDTQDLKSCSIRVWVQVPPRLQKCLRSSVVEHSTVNRVVIGSNPIEDAINAPVV